MYKVYKIIVAKIILNAKFARKTDNNNIKIYKNKKM
jgi:hypothetical protein